MALFGIGSDVDVDAIYCFCLARTTALLGAADGEILTDPSIEIAAFGDIAAIVTPVSREEFCGPAAESRLQDLAWVGPRACGHEAVVEAAMRVSPVLPARFGTLFSCRERLALWIETHRAAVCAALDRFAGHQEWAIKGALDTKTAEDGLLAAGFARCTWPGSPGARYLEAQRIRASVAQQLEVWVNEQRELMARSLLPHVADFRARKLPAVVTKAGSTPIFNWAALVRARGVAGLHHCVDQLNGTYASGGVTIECSGPWPPYSFSVWPEPDGEA